MIHLTIWATPDWTPEALSEGARILINGTPDSEKIVEEHDLTLDQAREMLFEKFGLNDTAGNKLGVAFAMDHALRWLTIAPKDYGNIYTFSRASTPYHLRQNPKENVSELAQLIKEFRLCINERGKRKCRRRARRFMRNVVVRSGGV